LHPAVWQRIPMVVKSISISNTTGRENLLRTSGMVRILHQLSLRSARAHPASRREKISNRR
jgi:hypothetical protein